MFTIMFYLECAAETTRASMHMYSTALCDDESRMCTDLPVNFVTRMTDP